MTTLRDGLWPALPGGPVARRAVLALGVASVVIVAASDAFGLGLPAAGRPERGGATAAAMMDELVAELGTGARTMRYEATLGAGSYKQVGLARLKSRLNFKGP